MFFVAVPPSNASRADVIFVVLPREASRERRNVGSENLKWGHVIPRRKYSRFLVINFAEALATLR